MQNIRVKWWANKNDKTKQKMLINKKSGFREDKDFFRLQKYKAFSDLYFKTLCQKEKKRGLINSNDEGLIILFHRSTHGWW